MQNRTMKPVVLAVLTVILLVAVIIIAVTLDRSNTVNGPADNGGSTSSQSHPSSTQSDTIEGSMGLTDNPFIN